MSAHARLRRLSLAFVLLSISITAAAQSRLTPVPPEGSSTIHYDLAADGRLLRINHETGAGHVVARFPIEQLDPSAVESGWYLPQYAFGYFFSGNFNRRRDLGLVLSFNALTGASQQLHSLDFNVDLDFCPISDKLHVLYIRGYRSDLIKQKNVIAAFESDIDFIYAIKSMSADGNLLYVISKAFPHAILKYDLRNLRSVYRLNQKSAIGCEGAENPGPLCVRQNTAAFNIWKRGSADRRIVVLNLDTPDCLLVSETMQGYSDEFVLTEASDGSNLLYGIETALYENDRLTWAGKVHRYRIDWKTKTISELPVLEYDATTSAFLLRRDGTPVIVPRLMFTYVSMDHLPRVFDNNPGITWEKRRELVAEIEAERKAKLGQRIEFSFRDRQVVHAEMRELNLDQAHEPH